MIQEIRAGELLRACLKRLLITDPGGHFLMKTASPGSYTPLDREGCRILADALGDTPETTISVHRLRDGFCRAYVAGDPARFDAAMVQDDFCSI